MTERRRSNGAIAVGLIFLALFSAVSFVLNLTLLAEVKKVAGQARRYALLAEAAAKANRLILNHLEIEQMEDTERDAARLKSLEEFRAIARRIDENNRIRHDDICRAVSCGRVRRLTPVTQPSPTPRASPTPRIPTPRIPTPPAPSPSPTRSCLLLRLGDLCL